MYFPSNIFGVQCHTSLSITSKCIFWQGSTPRILFLTLFFQVSNRKYGMNYANKDFSRLTTSTGRTQIGFRGWMLARSTKTIANISIVSSWAIVFFHKVSKTRFVELGLKIQMIEVCELRTLIVNKKEKDDPC